MGSVETQTAMSTKEDNTGEESKEPDYDEGKIELEEEREKQQRQRQTKSFEYL